MDDATVEILLKMKAEGLDAAKDTAAALSDVRNRMLEIMALNFQNAMAQALAPITGLWQGVQQLSGSLLGGIPFIGNFLTSLAGIPVVGAVAAVAIAALAIAVVGLTANFLLAAAAAVVLIGTTAAGFAGLALAATLALGPLALLAGGVLLLADRMFTTGKTAVDPLLQLEQALGKMADTWGARAFPMALQMTTWALGLVPAITAAGSALLDWFGQRLPQVFAFVNGAIGPVMDSLARLFTFFGYGIDQMLKQLPGLGPIFQGAMGAAVNATEGLWSNLMRFVAWFLAEWPKLQPIVVQVMAAAGQAVQYFGGLAAQLVDWFIANWPQISNTVRDLLPVLELLVLALRSVGYVFLAIINITDSIVANMGYIGRGFDDLGRQARNAANAIGSVAGAISNIPVIGGLLGGGSNFGGLLSGQGGGYVPGPIGAPAPAILHGGEVVLNPDQLNAMIGLLASIDRKLSGPGFSTRAYASRA